MKSLSIIVAFVVVLFSSGCKPDKKKTMRPVIASEWWVIAPEPDLSELGLQLPGGPGINETNDHHIFKASDGRWHLWACVRNTAAGRILAHWQSETLSDPVWDFTGEVIRADRSAGESLVDWKGQEFIQSPFILKEEGKYYLFYGGYDTGLDAAGDSLDPALDYNAAEKQICLMTSDDGLEWERYRNEQGLSRVFMGPGAVRDPCFRKFGDTWYVYYAGHHNQDRDQAAFYVRTSKDLIHWSDWVIAHFDSSSVGHWKPESPFVVEKEGAYYLFRTHGDGDAGVYVFRSSDPMNFGSPDPSDYFVCTLETMAPEIIRDEKGNYYISNIRGEGGYAIHLARLKWVADSAQAKQ